MEGDPKDFKDFDYDRERELEREQERIELKDFEKNEERINNEEDPLLENKRETSLIIPEVDVTNPIEDELDLDNIPNPKKDLADQRRIETLEQKDFLKDFLEFNVTKKDGPNSKELVEKFRIRLNQAGKVIGGKFEGENIIIKVGKRLIYSKNKLIQDSVSRFKELALKAKAEHFGTLPAQIEENIETQDMSSGRLEEITSQVSNDSLDDLIEFLDNYIKNLENMLDEVFLSEDKETSNHLLRTVRGYLNMPESQTTEEKLENLENEANHWRLRKLKETDLEKEAVYDALEKITKLCADKIRLENNMRVKELETQNILKKETELNDLNRFEKFKKFSRNNLVGLSAIATAIGGIITSVVISAISAVKKGAQATKKFAKAVAKTGKELGPIAAGVLNIISGIVSWGAKGISFLAQNLWILALALTWFVYDMYKNKRSFKK